MNLSKNQVVSVEIEDIGVNGEGIGKLEGYPLFVKDAIVGDYARVRITKPTKHTHMPDLRS